MRYVCEDRVVLITHKAARSTRCVLAAMLKS